MGLSGLRSPSRQRHKRSDKYQESRAIPAEMDKNYPVGRRESHAYEKSATALSVGIPRHNATAFGGGRMSTNRYGPHRETGRGALDLVRAGDVAEFVDPVARQIFEVMKFADVNPLLDQQVVVQRHERPVLISESLRVFGARLVFDAARIAADHNRAVLFDQPFRGLDRDAR